MVCVCAPQAKESNAVLLFDEAEGLFSERRDHSEKHALEEANLLLQLVRITHTPPDRHTPAACGQLRDLSRPCYLPACLSASWSLCCLHGRWRASTA